MERWEGGRREAEERERGAGHLFTHLASDHPFFCSRTSQNIPAHQEYPSTSSIQFYHQLQHKVTRTRRTCHNMRNQERTFAASAAVACEHGHNWSTVRCKIQSWLETSVTDTFPRRLPGMPSARQFATGPPERRHLAPIVLATAAPSKTSRSSRDDLRHFHQPL